MSKLVFHTIKGRSLLSLLACLLLIAWLSASRNFYINAGSVDMDRGADLPAGKPTGETVDTQNEELRMASLYGRVPLSFEPNLGQAAKDVQFVARSENSHLFLTSTGFTLSTQQKSLRVKLRGADPKAKGAGTQRLPGTVNYLMGDDPEVWQKDIPTFERVNFANIYRGIDVVYYSDGRRLEYDFYVRPGADPKTIRFNVSGRASSKINGDGDLAIDGDVILRRPVVYQEYDGTRTEIAGNYVRHGRRGFGFSIGEYDKSKPLIIDPVLSYSKVIAGDGANVGNGIAVDASGNAYVVGTTSSNNFPTANPFQAARGGFNDVFVMKLDPNGNVVYSTFLGGSSNDLGRGIAIDSSGNAYVTGWTFSTNFPVANAFQPARNTSPDAFLTKLSPSGSSLIYSTYFGGNNQDNSFAVAVDASNNAYITGQTFSSNFPTANASQAALSGTGDIFVSKFNPAGSALVYSTYLGGSESFEIGNGIAADADGNAYAVGQTASTNFPVLNAFQATKGDTSTSPIFDAFVTKFGPTGTRLFSTYLGGGSSDLAYGVALDASRNVYVTGTTGSFNFPLKNPLQATPNGNGTEAFVTELNAAGSALVYSTFLGGNADETAYGIAVEPATGKAVVTGKTNSPDFPAVRSIQSTGGGGIFQSEDGAATWNYANRGLVSPFSFAPAQDVRGLALDPVDSSIYAATGAGLFKSVAGVLPWKVVDQDFSAGSVTVDILNPSIVYAGNFGRVSKSIDAGKTWSSSTTGLPSEVISKIAVDPVNNSILYASTSITGAIYKSTDAGNTWGIANTGLPSLTVNALLIDPAAPSTIYVAVGFSSSSSAGVYKSTNGGGSWTRTNAGMSNSFVSGLAFDPTNSAIVYAATPSGLYKSTDNAGTWTQLLQTGNFGVLSVALDSRNASTIYVGTETFSGQGVLKTTDGGNTWTAKGLSDTRVTDILIDPFTSSITAYCGSLTSTDPSTDTFVSAVNPGGSSVLFSTYLGGTGRDEGHGIALDSGGNVFLTGATYSPDFSIQSSLNEEVGVYDRAETTSPDAASIPAKDLSGTSAGKIGGALGSDCPPITLSIPNPSCETGLMCNKQLYVHGGTPEWTLSRSGGVMPPGLTVTPDGFITGIPTATGTYNFTVDITDARGCKGSQNITFTVRPKTAGPVQIEKQVAAEDAYDPVNKTITFLVTVVNNTGVTGEFVMQDEINGRAVNPPAGWTCSSTASVTCKTERMVPGEVVTFTIVAEAFFYKPGDQVLNAAYARTDFKLNGVELRTRAAAVFTIPTPPTITKVIPASGPVGTSCDIQGTGFCEGTSSCTVAPTVKFNGTAAPLSGCPTTDTEICTIVPQGATTGNMCVDTRAGEACVPFTVTAGVTPTPTPSPTPTPTPTPTPIPPTITDFSPKNGAMVGGSVVIDGTGFTGATTVKFNGVPATFSVGDGTQIVATVPAGATTGPITITTPGGTATSSTNFIVIPTLTISSFSPAGGDVGTHVTITGSGFAAGGLNVKFNGVDVTQQIIVSDTEISVVVPVGATTGPISVTTTNGTVTSSSNFTVTSPCPTIITAIPEYASTDAEWNVDLGIDCPGGAVYETGGNLPRGVFVSPGGAGEHPSLRGTPNQLGSYSFTVTITCGTTKNTRYYSVTIRDASQLTPAQTSFQIGSVSGSASSVTANGKVTVAPRAASAAGALPSGYQADCSSVSFDVETTATANGPFEVDYAIPGSQSPIAAGESPEEAAAPAAKWRLLHLEQGILVDRTTNFDLNTNTIHSQVSTLGTFVVATAPTFATVNGKVISPTGRGVRGAVVAITDRSGVRRTAITNSLGFYSFSEVLAGQTYTLAATSKLYRFAAKTNQLINGDSVFDFFGLE